MNESISRAAGTLHGQELAPWQMETIIAGAMRRPQQRTTLYAPVSAERRTASFNAPALSDLVLTPFSGRRKPRETSSVNTESPRVK